MGVRLSSCVHFVLTNWSRQFARVQDRRSRWQDVYARGNDEKMKEVTCQQGDKMTRWKIEKGYQCKFIICRGITEEAVEAKVQSEFLQLFGIHEV